MSKTFAVIEDGVVVNKIHAESKEIAEEVTLKTCIEFTIELVDINGTFDGTDFIKVKPFASWTLDEEKQWIPPTPMPIDDKMYGWDEESLSWIEVV